MSYKDGKLMKELEKTLNKAVLPRIIIISCFTITDHRLNHLTRSASNMPSRAKKYRKPSCSVEAKATRTFLIGEHANFNVGH